MVILGAGGFAKEILQVVEENFSQERIAFFDDISVDAPTFLFDKFPVLRNQTELQAFFATEGSNFVVGIGNSKAREFLIEKITKLGGKLQSAIASKALIGPYSKIEIGATILGNSSISNSAQIGQAALIYYNAVVAHDCVLGDFVELSPGATLLGHVSVGNYTQIGANATILPRVKIGSNCIVGAGAVVTKDLADNVIVAGIPARVIKSKS